MKKFARILSIVMVIALALALAAPAMAADIGTPDPSMQPGSITIKNAIPGHTYTIYRIADLISFDATSGNYTYEVNDAWYDFLRNQGIAFNNTATGKHYVYGYVINDVEVFAAACLAQAKIIDTPSASKTAVVDTSATAGAAPHNGIVEFTDLPLGYYVVESSVGVTVGLTTTDYDKVFYEKNGVPTIDKYTFEDSGNPPFASKVNDADMSQPVNYMITVSKAAGAANYIVGDKLSAGLDLDASTISVHYNEANAADGSDVTGVLGTDYDLYLRADYNDADWLALLETLVGAANAPHFAEYTFMVKLSDSLLENMPIGKIVEVTYQCKLNENAIVGGVGNDNTATLVYGRDPFSMSEDVTTKTYTWDVKIFKYTGTQSNPTPLAGAGFTFYTANPTTATDLAAITMHFTSAGTNADGVPVYNYDPAGTVTEIMTDATGKFIIQGLDSTRYYMDETTTPPGYSYIQHPIVIDVTAINGTNGSQATYQGSTLTNSVSHTTDGWIMILNTTSVVLPETGGIGTIIFVSTGAFLVLTMGILLVVKKRMGSVIFTR